MPFYRIVSQGLTVDLHVQPGASRERIGGLHGEALKVRVTARAVEGKANRAVIRLLADELGLPPSRIEILSGDAARSKRIQVRCPAEKVKEVAARLERLAGA